MSSEYFEEREPEEEEVELLRREPSEEELIEAPPEEAPEFEDTKVLYDVTKPELLETMMIASEILTQASMGQISLAEAKRLYEREVVTRIKKLVTGGVVVKKKARTRRASKTKTEKAKERKTKKKSKEAEEKTEATEAKEKTAKKRRTRKKGGEVEKASTS